MSTAQISTGSTLKIGALTVAKLTTIDPPEMSKEEVDVTTLDSTGGYREFIPGFRDGGLLNIEGLVILGDAGQDGLKDNYDGDDLESFTITLANGESVTFDGYVSKYKRGSATVNEAIKFTAEIRASGVVEYASTASTGWSAFVLRNAADDGDATAEAIVPAIAASEYQYAVTFTTETSVRPKVTAASHTIKLYIDDVYSEDLTTATAGTAIAFGAADVKKLTIKVWEEDKTPKYYDLMVHRTS